MEVLNEISIFISIWFAIYNINSWRREHIGKRKIELAEEVLALFYEVKEVISYIRHPGFLSKETENIEQRPNETDNQYQARKNAFVVFKRYNEHIHLFSRLRSLRYRFMVEIGKEEAQPFDGVKEIVDEIMTAGRMLARLWAQNTFRDETEREKHQKKIEKYESIFWEGLKDPDPINTQLDEIISEIETTCNKLILGENSLHSLLNKIKNFISY